jgi:AcrR family transcriptional regulator
MPRDGSTTRASILSAAMRLFVEQGYDKTSLREIADEVGVTKAALYYHFRTKDDIVAAAYADYADDMGAILAWTEAQPAGPERDAGFADRILDFVDGEGRTALLFNQANPTVIARAEHAQLQVTIVTRLLAVLAGPDPTPEKSLRATLAYAALVLGSVAEATPLAPVGTPAERRAAARALALELLAAVR